MKLREWLTINETAEHLTLVLGETVLEKDIYRFVLDGHLRLSVDFINHAYVKKGKIVGLDDEEWFEAISNMFPTKSVEEDTHKIMKSDSIEGESFITFEDEVQVVDGIWDLMMIGSEELDIEHAYQSLTGGPEVTLVCMEGPFVERNGTVCQVQQSNDENPYQLGSLAKKKEIEIFLANNSIGVEEEKKIWEEFEKDRKNYLATRDLNPRESDYYPADTLPDDGVLVVKMTAIMNFLSSLGESNERPIKTKERHTLLIIIAALCKEAKIDYKQRGIANAIQHLTESIGAPVTDDTIRSVLNQIEQALDSRSK